MKDKLMWCFEKVTVAFIAVVFVLAIIIAIPFMIIFGGLQQRRTRR